MKKDTENLDRFIELRASGMSYARIAEELQVSKPTVIEWGKDKQAIAAIQTLKSITEQALLERHKVTTERRLEHYSKQLEKMLTELEQRTYVDVPTHKLLELIDLNLTRLTDNGMTVQDVHFLGDWNNLESLVNTDLP